MNTDDLNRAETATLFAMYDRTWTHTTLLPTDALHTLRARGLVEISPWAEYARITDAGNQLFEVCA